MSAFYSDPRMEMPELLEGRKPTGNVVIDKDHKLAKGVISYGLGLYDIATNSTLGYYDSKADARAGYLHFNDTKTSGEAIVLDNLNYDVFSGSTEISMFVFARMHTTTSNTNEDTLIGKFENAQGLNLASAKNYLLRYDSANNQLDAIAYDTADRVVSENAPSIEDGNWHVIGLIHRDSKIYPVLDGKILGSGVSCGAIQSTVANTYPEVMGGHAVTANHTDSPRFDLKGWVIYNRGLSNSEIKKLSDDFYQLLLTA